ncbi:carbohydrate kinase family protein [Plebeiibacterium sediminum]|uniref:Carbohydrate kinase n=1 Tax=Plebeiibacterium sediminum TaxID=2992112 RepID=A0AAE3M2N9_9BACT|nr:carbohydrate kinase [Plebeiobacterium sediminum]MCW3785727.1 carbohydrate kinase [Plebeiobacterium sediminum]
MRKVYGLGETVLDIIFKDIQPVSAKPGGSVLNAMVSLARLGHSVSFISELGNDKVGELVVKFLKDNNIDSTYLQRYEDAQSALALAFLNEKNDAEYDFYKNYPEERLNIDLPDFQKDDIFLFGSFYAIDSRLRSNILRIVQHAISKGCIVMYDPNFRKSHAKDLDQLLKYVLNNITSADIVRGSDEDFANIFGAKTSEDAYRLVSDRCMNMVYTANANGVYLHTNQLEEKYEVNQIESVSTIGAGDNFNAGIIHSILKQGILKQDLKNLTKTQWNNIIESGIQLSAEVCMSLDNYISR